jgi:superfamily I DNA/RNA helicase
MSDDVKRELDEAIGRILASKSPKKLVVAGPGAGKTTVFRKLLDGSAGRADDRLVLTFINNLKADLEGSLGDAAGVFTLHGYCQQLLHRREELRGGLSAKFRCYPGLASLIKQDWEYLRGSKAPLFIDLMRHLECLADQENFYLERANYYDAVDFDDSVYRVQSRLTADGSLTPTYDLVLIDEFQDFNKMEAGVIEALAEASSIVIAGDDDQALYSQLRGASWDHIRTHYESGHYEIFELPFCMRCPEVIVQAVGDIISRARAGNRLDGRIDKPYRYFEPVKGEDSKRYPTIELVETSVQRGNANYFGQYIEKCIRAIPEADVKLAAENGEPVVLIIGSDPYRRQVREYLEKKGLVTAAEESSVSEREQALEILAEDPQSNLGWRIILSCGDDTVARAIMRAVALVGTPLANAIPAADRDAILTEAKAWEANRVQEKDDDVPVKVPPVKVVSFEGSKGASAQYVFLLGLQAGDMPRNPADIKDIEICRFLVGLTRTKKKCEILVTKRFGEKFKRRSVFLGWIKPVRYSEKQVDATYWKK